MFLTHVKALSELLNTEKFAIIQARKFSKYYARTLPDRLSLIKDMTHCDSIEGLTQVVNRHFID
jgi:hypothetical protein